MWSDLEREWWVLACLAVLTLLAIPAGGVLLWRGWHDRPPLAAMPPRRTGLWFGDVIAAVLITLVGMVALVTSGSVTADPLQPTQLVRTVVMSQLLTQLPIVLYVLWRVGHLRHGVAELGLHRKRLLHQCATAVLGLLVAIPLVVWVNIVCAAAWTMISGELIQEVGHPMLVALQSLLESGQVMPIVVLLVSAAVVAPLLEEIIFRGLLQTALLSALGAKRRWLVVLGASLFFAAVHASAVPPYALPGLFVLAIVLGWLYERTGSLWPSILVHVGFNAVNIALAIVMTRLSDLN